MRMNYLRVLRVEDFVVLLVAALVLVAVFEVLFVPVPAVLEVST